MPRKLRVPERRKDQEGLRSRYELVARILSRTRCTMKFVEDKIPSTLLKRGVYHLTLPGDRTMGDMFPLDQTHPELTKVPDQVWLPFARRVCTFHEAGHIRFTNFGMELDFLENWANDQAARKIAYVISNIIEDARIERAFGQQYNIEWQFLLLRHAYGLGMRKVTETQLKGPINLDENNALHQFIFWLYQKCLYDDGTKLSYHDTTKKVIAIVSSLVNRAVEAPALKNSYIFRKMIVDEVLKHFPKMPVDVNACPTFAHPDHFGQLPTKSDELSLRRQGKGQNLPVKITLQQDNSIPDFAKIKEQLQHAADAGRPQEKQNIDQDVKKYEQIIEDQKKNFELILPGDKHTLLAPEIQRVGEMVASKLESLLERTKATRYQRPLTRGMLDSRVLYRIEQPTLRLFKRRVRPDTPEYYIFVLIDRSSSMSQPEDEDSDIKKIQLAENILAAFVYACDKVGIKTEVLGFNTRTLHFHKSFREDADNCWGRLLTAFAHGQTPLPSALKVVGERMRSVPQGKKFLLAITDGQPTEETTGTKAIPFVKTGIGIRMPKDHKMEEMFDHFVGVRHLRELPGVLENLLKRIIL